MYISSYIYFYAFCVGIVSLYSEYHSCQALQNFVITGQFSYLSTFHFNSQIFLFFSFFFFFFSHALRMCKFPGQRLNPHHSSDNARSLPKRLPGDSHSSPFFFISLYLLMLRANVPQSLVLMLACAYFHLHCFCIYISQALIFLYQLPVKYAGSLTLNLWKCQT